MISHEETADGSMDLAGYVGGWPRRPLLPLDGSARAGLRSMLETEGLL